MEIKIGDAVTTLGETFKVEKIEERYSFRSQRRELMVVCKGLVWPIARLTIIAGKITTC